MRASLSVTKEVLQLYWSIVRDITSKQWANTYGSAFYKTLSRDMRREIPDAQGFYETNLKYMSYFYSLYSQRIENRLPGVDDFSTSNHPQPADDSLRQNLPRVVEDLQNRPHPVDDLTADELFSVPWFHHRTIIDKCKDNVDKAIFYVRKTIQHNWEREMARPLGKEKTTNE
ncbi:MAG: hypothetical protein HUK14_00500 [Muribaculaceae bacterium]|nr:hypothetical protein [Muribaculaceae bacterium]